MFKYAIHMHVLFSMWPMTTQNIELTFQVAISYAFESKKTDIIDTSKSSQHFAINHFVG